MNWVDLAIVVSIAWFTFAAFKAGLVREVVTIAGAIAAVALAGLLYRDLAPDVALVIDSERTAEVVAFGIIFGAVLLASQLIAFFLKQAVSVLMLGFVDSLGGAVIGLVKGFVLVQIALIAGITFETLGVRNAIEGSALAPLFLDLLPLLRHILPEEFRSAIDNFNA